MKHFATTQPADERFIKLSLAKLGWTEEDFQKHNEARHPQEDAFVASKTLPIFAVADGVTLIQYILEKKDYPDPSPAGEVARVFCEEAVREAEKRYEHFSKTDLVDVFKAANAAVQKLQREHSDYWFNDLYAATGAFAVVKENKVYWASICDSYVAHFGREGQFLFKSPNCDSFMEASVPQFTGDRSNRGEKARYRWEVQRNGLNAEGKRIGYGVITGEENASKYLSTGVIEMGEGDLIMLHTDGFEEYVSLPEFVSLFNGPFSDLGARLEAFTEEKIKENPDAFGRERTLVAFRM